ncbi:MAG: pyridoxamine 5'-phosphate oxidase [Acidimicrobiales bacterium]|nr:pyridoxamine 5'-phosphate oxidase [Acidimicrobiales bacterium]
MGHFREDYTVSSLRRVDLAEDPVLQFQRWWDDWTAVDRYDAAACVLATATPDGRPSARYVLCRSFGERGFDIYTNLASRKGRELSANPHGAIVFGWLEANRQVRIEGVVDELEPDVVDDYWRSRPRGSRIGAWASDQSRILSDRDELDRRAAAMAEEFGADPALDADHPVPRPNDWGGYRLVPESYEFWQGRPDRLHDRFLYVRGADGSWSIDRLAP